MHKRLQIVCLIFVGIDAVLFAVWGHLTDSIIPLVVVAIGTFIGYLSLLSRLFTDADNAFLIRGAKHIFAFLLKTVQRAACSSLTALAVCAFLIWHIATLTVDVEINVEPQEKLHMPDLESKPFRIEIQRLGRDPEKYERKKGKKLHISFPLSEQQRSIDVTVKHDGYETTSIKKKIEELSSGPVVIRPKPLPVLVVRVHRLRKPSITLNSFRVKAWAAGRGDTTAPERELTSAGEAEFVAAYSQDWFVAVHDSSRNRVHYSPSIVLDSQRKSYLIDLDDDTYKWYDIRTAAPPELAQVNFPTHALATSVGESLVRSDVGNFLFGGAPSGGKVILRKGYVVSYNPVLKVPNWVAYRLDNLPDQPSIQRPDIVPDPDLNSSVTETIPDFRVSIRPYDRGHLVSPVDMRRLGEQVAREASYYSALAPQTPFMNRYTWRAIEQMARTYVAELGESIYIMAGPAFLDTSAANHLDEHSVRTIGNGVAVPTHFFRVHIRLVKDRPDVLAFLVPNDSDLDRDPANYIASLATIENATGLRFFLELPSDQQPNREHIPDTLWIPH